MNNPRRIFLKVLATGPLVGCAGADPAGSLPGGPGGGDGTAVDGSGAAAAGGKPANSGGSASAGNAFASGGSTTGGNAFTSNGGSTTGGNAFTNSGGAGGFSFASGGSAAGTATSAGAAGSSTSSFSMVDAGNVSAIAVGQLIVVAGIFLMGRDAKGIYVMSMQCTHKGCALVFSGAQLDCPCHHSRFDSNGNVLVGPATAPLPHLALSVDAAGNITVDRYTVVSSSMRTPV